MTEAAGRRTLDMIGNAHLDAVWLWPWQEGYSEVRATIRSALDRLDEDPDFLFTCDSVAYYAWVEESDPDLFERMRSRIAEGRWEPTGGWWVEPDCNLPSGESFVRQGLYGQRYLQDRFGRMATVGMNVDPFGHNATLPQILRALGLASYVFHRPGPHEMTLPGPLFRWRSADGTEVLAYRIPHEYCTPAGDVGNHVDKTIAHLPPGTDPLMCFYGVGNHGGGPTKANIASIRRIGAATGQPSLRFSTPNRFFAERRAAGIDDVPIVDGELQHHAVGCYSAHSEIKALNRRVERVLATAETWSTIAATPEDARLDLERAWKQLLFNQFHDILAGTAIRSAYVDARDQLGEAASIASRVLNRAVQEIARQVRIEDIAETAPLLVFNSLPWPVTVDTEFEFGATAGWDGEADITDADGVLIPYQRTRSEAMFPNRRRVVFSAELPALGYRLYRMWPEGLRARGSTADQVPPRSGTSSGTFDLRATETSLENRLLRIEIDPTTGWLSALEDKVTGTSLLAPAGGPHAVVIDDDSDTWGHRTSRYDGVRHGFTVDSIRLVEYGPVRAVVRVERVFGGSRLVEELVLGRESTMLEVRVTLDWQEQLRLLKLRVGTALLDPVATYDIGYGHIVRPADGHEEVGHRWVDVSGTLADGTPAGLSLLNDAKYSFDIDGGDIGITAARSPVYAWHEPSRLRPDDVYDYQDQGRQSFRYALLPHAGDWRTAGTVRQAATFAQAPVVHLEPAHDGVRPHTDSLLGVDSGSVVVGVVKSSEDAGDDVVIRGYETAGATDEATIDVRFLDRQFRTAFAPHQIKTFRVPRDVDRPVVETDLLEHPVESEVDPTMSRARRRR